MFFDGLRRRVIGKRIRPDVISKVQFKNSSCCKEVELELCENHARERKTGIAEIALMEQLVCVLLHSGVAIAYDRCTTNRVCSLNDSDNQVIRSVCYNSWNSTLVIVWHAKVINTGLQLTVLDAEALKQGQRIVLHNFGRRLQQLRIPFPGFVEFEEMNGRVVTSTSQDEMFRFWDMKTYEEIFSISNVDYGEIRISRGTVAFFKQPMDDGLDVRLCHILDGKIKQEGACLRVHDLIDGSVSRVSGTRSFQPRAVTFFPAEATSQQILPSRGPTHFVAVHDTSMEVCTCSGGTLHRLLTLHFPPPESPADCLQVVHSRNVMLVYFNKSRSGDAPLFLEDGGSPLAFRSANSLRKASIGGSEDDKENADSSEDGILRSKLEVSAFEGSMKKRLAKDILETGIHVIDLTTGKRLGVIQMDCDDDISVFTFDMLQQEIWAGGRRALHHVSSEQSSLPVARGETKTAFWIGKHLHSPTSDGSPRVGTQEEKQEDPCTPPPKRRRRRTVRLPPHARKRTCHQP